MRRQIQLQPKEADGVERKGIAMGMEMGRKGVGSRKSDNEPQGLSSSSSATSDRNLGGVRVEEKEKEKVLCGET